MVTTKEKYLAKALVGGDGVYSSVARLVNLRKTWKPNEVGMAAEAILPLTKDIDEDVLQIHLGVIPFGYGWVFPRKKTVSAGLGTTNPRFFSQMKRFFDFVKEIYGRPTNFKPYPHLIQLSGCSSRLNIFTDRVILVGDAVGFVDPLTWEGIYYAIVSGELAAYTISEAIQEGPLNERLLRKYLEMCRNMIWRKMRIAFHLSRAFYANLNLIERLLLANKTISGCLLKMALTRISNK